MKDHLKFVLGQTALELEDRECFLSQDLADVELEQVDGECSDPLILDHDDQVVVADEEYCCSDQTRTYGAQIADYDQTQHTP